MPIHPDIAGKLSLLDGIPSAAAALADPSLFAQLDRYSASLQGDPPPEVTTSTTQVPGPHGPVPVRVYQPTGKEPGPSLVWVHGGGWLSGDLDMAEADWVGRDLCARAGLTVISVDYRLAVDGVHFPVPHDDVVAALRWARDNAVELGIDTSRITLGGASAGGNLAAGAALRVRDDDQWLPHRLLLVYPALHPTLPPAAPQVAAQLTEVPACLRFPPDIVDALVGNYLGAGTADGYSMPGLADLTGLSRTLVLNAEYDDIRTSGETFTESALSAGVEVEQVLIPSMLHGFLNLNRDYAPVATALDLMSDFVTSTR